MNKLVSAMHDATHQVPGMPVHRENPLSRHPGSRRSNEHPRLQSRERRHQAPQHHQTPPRVLIAWQNWIGRHIGRNDR